MIHKSTNERFLEYLFTYPTREIHLRELSRQTQTSMPSLLLNMKRFSENGLIIVKKSRAFTFIKANADNKDFVRAKRMYNLKTLYSSGLIDYLAHKLHNPSAIVCFGSYSRGDDVESSDIDIGILGAKDQVVTLDIYEKRLNRSISLHFIDMNKVSPEFKSNISNGIVLDGAI